jgi:hypothetical protein
MSYLELVKPISDYRLIPEASRVRHRVLTALGLPASLVDPYPTWILQRREPLAASGRVYQRSSEALTRERSSAPNALLKRWTPCCSCDGSAAPSGTPPRLNHVTPRSLSSRISRQKSPTEAVASYPRGQLAPTL